MPGREPLEMTSDGSGGDSSRGGGAARAAGSATLRGLRRTEGRRPGSPGSLALAVLVHAAIGGIVWALIVLAPPPAPDTEDERFPPITWEPGRQPPGGTRPKGRPPSSDRRIKRAERRTVTAAQPPAPPIDAAPIDDTAIDDAPLDEGERVGDPSGDETGRDPSGPWGPGGPGEGPGDSGGIGDAHAWDPSEPVVLTSDLQQPRLIRRVEPRFPSMAERMGAQGVVTLRCVIGTDGSVSVREVLRSVRGLDAAAIEAVEQWRYEPALRDGRPQAVLLVVRLQFRRR